MQRACRPRPLERSKVVRPELGEDALGLGADAPRLVEALPGVGFYFEILTGLHAEVGPNPVADEHIEQPL